MQLPRAALTPQITKGGDVIDVIGIVGEYNPFHKGHEYHIKEMRRAVGRESCVICVMSGNFVQRGDVAIFEKHARAEAAVCGGADIVFELPLPWCLSSAEGFARGAVALLASLGVVTHLGFGSESGDVASLSEIAEELLRPDMHAAIYAELEADPTVQYAVARHRALTARIGDKARIIETPNNILAVEYMKAIYDIRQSIIPVTIKRSGVGHDGKSGKGFRSAQEIRGIIGSGNDIAGFVPKAAREVYAREIALGRGPVSMESVEQAILSRLRFLSERVFSQVPDADEGIESRLARAAWSEPSVDAVLAATKTKRYALSRLRRMLMSACLGITGEMSRGLPPYARLLAAGRKGRELLRLISERSDIPVITKPAAVKRLGRDERALFELEAAATDFYSLGFFAKEERRGGADWRNSPVIIDD